MGEADFITTNRAKANTQAKRLSDLGRRVEIISLGKNLFAVKDKGKLGTSPNGKGPVTSPIAKQLGFKVPKRIGSRLGSFVSSGARGIRIPIPKRKVISRSTVVRNLSSRRRQTAERILRSNASVATKLRARRLLRV